MTAAGCSLRLIEQAVATAPVTAEALRHGYHCPPVPDPLGTGTTSVLILEVLPVSAASCAPTSPPKAGSAFIAAPGDPKLAVRQTGLLRPDVIVADATLDIDALAQLRKAASTGGLVAVDTTATAARQANGRHHRDLPPVPPHRPHRSHRSRHTPPELPF